MTQESRRKIVKGLAITLPVTWATPVVQSVILPAHAVTSALPVEEGPTSGPPVEEGLTGIFLTTEVIEVSSGAGPVMLAIALCSDIVNNVASVTGVVGSVLFNESGIAVPGTTEISNSGVTAEIGLKTVSGTAPNRQLITSVEISGDFTFGPQDFTSPEAQQCPSG